MAVRPSSIPAALGPGPTLPRPLRRLAGCGGSLQPGRGSPGDAGVRDGRLQRA